MAPSWTERWKAIELAAKELRSLGEWDLGISLPNSLSAAALLYRAGVKKRRGYPGDGRGLLLNEKILKRTTDSAHRADAYVRLLPEVESQLKIAPQKFWGVPPENDLDPGIPGVMQRFDAARSWPESRPIEPPKQDYWVLAPGSNAESRRWPVERFADLARRIVSETGWPGLVVGGAGEARLAEELVDDRTLKLQNWTALGDVADYSQLFSRARLTVSNDSGLAHVAALCGSSVHVVWGAGDPRRTQPIGPGRVKITLNPVDCWPCERNQCALTGNQKLQCLRGIESGRVREEMTLGRSS
jgi:ADP-heptose:LPS heptosyltransferase